MEGKKAKVSPAQSKGNIALIGMPGAGKSTIGVLLAKTLGLSFIDTDLLIQLKSGRLLQEIIDRDGVRAFLAVEEDILLRLEVERSLIATGGSAVYSEPAMEHLRRLALIVYLRLDLAEVERRIKNITARGIAMAAGQSLAELYAERVPLYEKYADVVFDCTERQIEESVGAIALISAAYLGR